MTNRKLWRVDIHTILVIVASLAVAATSCGRGAEVGEVKPGGNWIDNMRSEIRTHFTDGDTAERLLVEVDRLEEIVLAFDAATITYYERLRELDRNYNSSRHDFEEAIGDFNAVRIEHRNKVMDIRFRMRELTTPDDWEKLSDIDETLLSQWERQFEL